MLLYQYLSIRNPSRVSLNVTVSITVRLTIVVLNHATGGAGITEDIVDSDPWIVRFARKLAEKNPDLVIAKGQRTCQVLLLLNLFAVLGEWTLNILFFL